MKKTVSTLGTILLFSFILFLFLFGDRLIDVGSSEGFSQSLLNVNTIFVGIVLEALPFILIGVFASSLIQVFVKEEWLVKVIPKKPILSIIPAILVGALLPICECAIVPVVRRLLSKGMPVYVAMVLFVSAPVLNPIVFASTFYSFQGVPEVYWGRMILAALVALVIGYYFVMKNFTSVLKTDAVLVSHNHQTKGFKNKANEILQHMSDEFFDVGKFLLLGAFIAASFQAFFPRDILETVGQSTIVSPVVMMVLAYILSLCSEADAFVAASFANSFSIPAILAFLVYGPMIDLKNTLLMLAYFKKGFVLRFISVVTISVFVIIMLFSVWLGVTS